VFKSSIDKEIEFCLEWGGVEVLEDEVEGKEVAVFDEVGVKNVMGSFGKESLSHKSIGVIGT